MTILDQPAEKLARPHPLGQNEVISRRARSIDAPTTFAQERLWFLDRLEIGSAAYNLLTAFRISGKVNLPALQKSLADIVQRHEILRTVFSVKNELPIQAIVPSLLMDLPLVVDMKGCSEAERAAFIQEMLHGELTTTFDSEYGPLFYVKLFQFAEDDALLLLKAHQAAFDKASVTIFLEELSTRYNTYASDGLVNLPALPFQYGDYAAWQRGWMQGSTESRLLDYWKKHLNGASHVLELPTDRPRPTLLSFAGQACAFSLPANLTHQLENLSERLGVELSDVLLAAFQVLIFRYTNHEDMLIGTSVSNRLQVGTDALIGNFMNLLVLRSQFSGETPFREVLKQVQQTMGEAITHQSYPFEKLLDELKPERDISRPPLVQVTFDYGESSALPTLHGLTVEELPIPSITSRYDLSLSIGHRDGGLHGKVEYCSDLFEASTTERMATHFQMLLQGIVNNPDEAIAKLPLLTEPERHQVLVTWNNTRRDDLRMVCLHQIFEEQVIQTPDRIAVAFQDQQMTYAELNRRANRLAYFLIENGIQQDVVVAILADRNINYLIAMLATLKAGGAFLPLNTRQPVERQAQILTQCAAPIALGSDAFLSILREAAEKIPTPPKIHLIDDLLTLEGYGEENPPLRTTLDSLAYMMFTSGSTGLPKGVMVEHRGMINHNYAKIADLGMTETDILAQNGPQSFDIMVWQFLAPLIIGGRVHIFEDDIAYNPIRLLDEIENVGITVLQIVPALLHIMIQEAETRAENRPTLQKLRWVVPTGEALPTEMCRQWLRLYPQIPLLNTYGSTECSDDQCHYPVTEIPAPEYRLPIMTIGRPIFNMQIYVLDKWLQPAPIGVIGELYVGGIGVGRGYLNDPEKTQKAFIADPFTQDRPGAKLYKTGDQGRYMPDGTIEFLGRVDHMVKVRGFRIELGEIEAVVAQHPAIKQNVVVVREEGNAKMLVGYVVSDAATPPTNAELREYVGGKLPDYMVPTLFITLDAMPLNANGKIDRKALPSPDISKAWDENYVAPRNEIEEDLAKVWAEVIKLPRVGVRDNFFELGGHSLLAIRIFSHIDKKYGKQLPLGTLFRTPTIEQLAQVLEGDFAPDLWSPLVAIQATGDLPPFFCVAGGVLHMRNLSHHLGHNQPVYALQIETIDDEQLASVQLDVIAREALKEVRAIQPHGPYYLGGSFGGGMVALAMAQELIQQGEEVAFLIAFNTLIKRNESPFIVRAMRRARAAIHLNPVKIYRRLRDDVDWENAKEYAMGTVWKVAFKISKITGRPMPRFLRTGYYGELLLRYAANQYQSQGGYTGDIALFVAREWYGEDSADPTWGWGNLTSGEIDIQVVPGDPCTIFSEPNVYTVSKELEKRLAKARGEK